MPNVSDGRRRAGKTADRICLWLLLAGLPLVFHRGYFDITETKTLYFAVVSAGYCLARGVIALQFGAAFRRLTISEILALAFCGAALLASVMSGRFWESFLGPRGRWQGAGMILLYAGLFFLFPSGKMGKKEILPPLITGFFLSGSLAVINHLGWDPLRLSVPLAAADRGRYISTLGNINFAGAYFCLVLPVTVWETLAGEMRSWRAVCGAVSVVGVWACMAVRSECTVLGLGAALALMPLLMKGRPEALRRWPRLWIALPCAMQACRWAAQSRGAYLSALTRLLLRPWPTGGMVLAGAALCLWLGRVRPETADRAAGRYRRLLAALAAGGIVLAVLFNTAWKETGPAALSALGPWLRLTPEWGTDRGRIWAYCLELFRSFPLPEKLLGGGCGVLAWLDVTRRIFPDAVLDAAHNEYLQILLCWGAAGLAVYLGWLGTAVRDTVRTRDGLSLALLAGLIGYAVQAVVNIAQAPGISLFFLLLSLARRNALSAGIDLCSKDDIIKTVEKPTEKGA